MSFFKLITAAVAFTTALAAPANVRDVASAELLERPEYIHLQGDNLTGVNFVADRYSNQFQINWTLLGDPGTTVVAGKGWSTGKARNISYTGSYYSSNVGFIGAYGWSKNPEVEYYVVESFATHNPVANGVNMGTFKSDNGTYAIYRRVQYNQPSYDGSLKTYVQYWSIRLNRRVEGTITLKNHIDAWASKGMALGNLQYQVFALQAAYGKGNATFTISDA